MKNRLAGLRTEHGMTQNDLAQAVETSRQTIISLEKGRYEPSLRLAMKLADVFDTNVEHIFELD